MKGQTMVIVALVFTIIISVFALANMSTVEINYIFGTGSLPLVLIILFSVLIGSIITMSFSIAKYLQLKRQNKDLLEQLKEREIVREEHIIDPLIEEAKMEQQTVEKSFTQEGQVFEHDNVERDSNINEKRE